MKGPTGEPDRRLCNSLKHSYDSYVKRVKTANLKNNLSRHLTFVRGGGTIVVLDRDTPVARIVPFDRPEPAATDARPRQADDYWTEERMTALEQRGVITRPRRHAMERWLKTSKPIKLPEGSPSAVALLLQMRRESTR